MLAVMPDVAVCVVDIAVISVGISDTSAILSHWRESRQESWQESLEGVTA